MGYSAAALVITAILLPVLSAFTQYLNMKLSMAVNGSNRPADKDDLISSNNENYEYDNASVLTGYGIYITDWYRYLLDRQCNRTYGSAGIYQQTSQ